MPATPESVKIGEAMPRSEQLVIEAVARPEDEDILRLDVAVDEFVAEQPLARAGEKFAKLDGLIHGEAPRFEEEARAGGLNVLHDVVMGRSAGR